jgi:hypothetical protein
MKARLIRPRPRVVKPSLGFPLATGGQDPCPLD